MANMYPKNITEYTPEDSERIVYQELKNQLPNSWDVFYSVPWTTYKRGRRIKSEADFIVCSPEYGFLCLEVKGGSQIRKENDTWYLNDITYGERKLNESPYDQAEKSMYYFESVFSNMYNLRYPGIFGAGVVFPFYAIPEELNLDNRQRSCTIDCYDLNHLADRIKKMFKLWGGSTYGLRIYSLEQHRALVELIRDRIAISAAAGALIRYDLPQYVDDGWEKSKEYKNPKYISVTREKSIQEQFENKIWLLFASMGFTNMNADSDFHMSYDFHDESLVHQVDRGIVCSNR